MVKQYKLPLIIFRLKKTAILVSLIVLKLSGVNAQTVVINEVMKSNASVITDIDGDAEDWIELYNFGETTINLQNWGLSNCEDQPYKWVIPDVNIESGEFLLIWFSGKNLTNPNNLLHTNFSICSSGETIYLTNSEGTTIDYIIPVEMMTDISYGRKPDGSNNWCFFTEPTPLFENIESEVYSEILSVPEFSHEGGWYSEGFPLYFTNAEPNTKIIYTTDGSDPDLVNNPDNTYEYEGHFFIEKELLEESNSVSFIRGNVATGNNSNLLAWFPPYEIPKKANIIKAQKISSENRIPSPIVSNTYFIDFHDSEANNEYNLPVISIITDKSNFFDKYSEPPNTGIMVPYYLWLSNAPFRFARGLEWECNIHIELYEADGTKAFAHAAGARVHGGWSRIAAQKNLRIYFRNIYGERQLKYPLFSHGQETHQMQSNFKRFILRTGSSEVWQTLIRDGLMQDLVGEMDIDRQAHQPSVLFINGEYWGVHNIRERVDKYYIADKYNIDENELTITDGGNDNYGLIVLEDSDMMQIIMNNDMSEQSNYDIVKEVMDINSFIDYNVAQLYFSNGDWPQNNLKAWNSDDFSWRFLMFDVDCGFNRHETGMQDVKQIERVCENQMYPLVHLLDNLEFKQNFISRFADMLNTIFIPEYVTNKILEYASEIEHLMPEYFRRWGVRNYVSYEYISEEDAMEHWENQIQNMIEFANLRPNYKRQHIQEFFHLGSQLQLTVDICSEDRGYLHVNTIEITENTLGIEANPYPWEGIYFEDIPIELFAVPNLGYKFSHWSGDIYSENENLTVYPSGDLSLKANFISTDSYEEIIYYWTFDSDLPNNTPLESVVNTYSANNKTAVIYYNSCFEHYPFEPRHFYWRKSSLERRNAPTEINYYPEANYGIEYNEFDMRGLQIKQPLNYDNKQSSLILKFSTIDLKDIKISFAAMNEGAANIITIDYLNNGNWTNANLEDFIKNISPIYELYEIDLSNIDALSNNEESMIRLRFFGEDANEDGGERISFNNIAVSGIKITEESFIEPSEILSVVNIYPNPFSDYFIIECSEEITRLSITNVNGQELKKINPYAENITVFSGDMSPGIYYITIQTYKGSTSKSVVKL